MALKEHENADTGFSLPLSDWADQLAWSDDGLIPAIAQQYDTGEVLMLAWVNREALMISLSEGVACYWSRSRQRLWRKGESSGQQQRLVECRADCDGDALLYLVDQTGAACHTGRASCFYWRVDGNQVELDRDRLIDADDLYS